MDPFNILILGNGVFSPVKKSSLSNGPLILRKGIVITLGLTDLKKNVDYTTQK